MQSQQTKLPGLTLIDLKIHEDKRGSFREVWHTDKFAELGLGRLDIRQYNVAESRRGATRGIHAEPWDKLVHVPAGRVFAAIIDMHKEAETFGQYETFELDRTKALFIPQGYGNSYQALTDDVIYTYIQTGVFKPEETPYPALAYNDPDLAVPWPVSEEERIISEKDTNNPTLKEYRNEQ